MSDRPAPNAAAEPEVVRYRTDGPVAYVTLARPGFSNAQNARMTYAIGDAYRAAVEDDDVAVIVLAGEGRHFVTRSSACRS